MQRRRIGADGSGIDLGFERQLHILGRGEGRHDGDGLACARDQIGWRSLDTFVGNGSFLRACHRDELGDEPAEMLGRFLYFTDRLDILGLVTDIALQQRKMDPAMLARHLLGSARDDMKPAIPGYPNAERALRPIAFSRNNRPALAA